MMNLIESLKNKVDVYCYIGKCFVKGVFKNEDSKEISYEFYKVACGHLREITASGEMLYSGIDVFKVAPSFDIDSLEISDFFTPYFDKNDRLAHVEFIEEV